MVKKKKTMRWAISSSNIQHISESACFDLNAYILFKLKHIWERNAAHGMQMTVVKIALYCKNTNFQTLLVMQSSLILLGLSDMQLPNKCFYLKNIETEFSLISPGFKGLISITILTVLLCHKIHFHVKIKIQAN